MEAELDQTNPGATFTVYLLLKAKSPPEHRPEKADELLESTVAVPK